MKAVQIVPVRTPEELAQVRGLFLEYGESLSFHLCFDSFQTELNGLPGDYAPPRGELFLAGCGALPVGCVH